MLLAYALPFIHNVQCVELPFSSGQDLALLYLGLPAAVIAIFGGRWIARRSGFRSPRAIELLTGGGLFLWIVILGQGDVVLANALLSPQRPVVYEGVVVDKVAEGFLPTYLVLRVELASHEVVSLKVNVNEYAHLQIGDRIAKPAVLGALQIPYVPRCRWLPYAKTRGM